jgi:hypothetical protein
MKIEYEIPAAPRSTGRKIALAVAIAAVVVIGCVGLFVFGEHFSLAAGLAGLGILFVINTVTYETPVVGVTAPTATQSRPHQQISAVVTGDGAATTFTLTHNWGLTAADLAAGWAEVELEYLLAAGYTAAALITSKTANTVVFSCTAFTGAGLRVRLKRPWSATR